ncbi:hypothetical protein [Polaribacter aestuariivivens]|uniref:hypothetical protein n=1 Tax=Polaribacter aestuariivivens TaxID=2304626 RepID=UPI003F49245F
MIHYKAILSLNTRIAELQNKISELENIDEKLHDYSGYVFIQNDIDNIKKEIKELTYSAQFLIDVSKK